MSGGIFFGDDVVVLQPGDCPHEDYEPVTLLLTGEHVASICVACHEQLPASPSFMRIVPNKAY